jgi:hypothetical protein
MSKKAERIQLLGFIYAQFATKKRTLLNSCPKNVRFLKLTRDVKCC